MTGWGSAGGFRGCGDGAKKTTLRGKNCVGPIVRLLNPAEWIQSVKAEWCEGAGGPTAPPHSSSPPQPSCCLRRWMSTSEQASWNTKFKPCARWCSVVLTAELVTWANPAGWRVSAHSAGDWAHGQHDLHRSLQLQSIYISIDKWHCQQSCDWKEKEMSVYYFLYIHICIYRSIYFLLMYINMWVCVYLYLIRFTF